MATDGLALLAKEAGGSEKDVAAVKLLQEVMKEMRGEMLALILAAFPTSTPEDVLKAQNLAEALSETAFAKMTRFAELGGQGG